MQQFKALTNALCNLQGTAFKADLVTNERSTLIEIPIAEIPDIISLLGVIANQAGSIRKVPQHIELGPQTPMPYIDAGAMAISLGKPGCVGLQLRVGAVDLLFQLPHEAFQMAMQTLPSAALTVAAVAKASQQEKGPAA